MVFLLPLNGAHAASPTVTLSTITSGVSTAVTSGTVGTTLVITGTGFGPAKSITIITTVGTTTVPWLTGGSCAITNSGVGTKDSLATPTGAAACLTTSATGGFQVSAKVPNLPGGPQTITVSDGTNPATSAFSVTPKVAITLAANNYGFPEESVTPTITVTGFGSGESVTGSTIAFTVASTSLACTTGSSVGSYGFCQLFSGLTTVADTNAGSKTITATGATSALTASTTYTVNPWAAFYNSAAGSVSTFSFIGAAPTSLLVEVHGAQAATIASGTITIGGAATNHQAITPGSSGTIFGLVVSPTSNVPYGLVSVVIGGVTYSYAAGNILLTQLAASQTTNYWGGALISSVKGTTGVTTGVVATDASTYKPGTPTLTTVATSPAPQPNTIAFFGYGFVSTFAVTVNTPTGASFTPIRAPGVADANGAFFSTQALGETPWSTSTAPTAAASYTAQVTQASGPANILSPSFGITPWVDTTTGGITVTSVDYTSSTQAKVHGFGATDTVTITIGGSAMVSGGTIAVTNGAGTTASGKVPDLAGGAQNLVATGSISGQTFTATGAITYSPIADFTLGQTLSINSGAAGSTTVIRTGNGYGVHGLLASTAYNIVWNAQGGSVIVGSFTSTATGAIPIPGVQFTIPSDSSGIHIVDVQTTAGNSAIYGQTNVGDVAPNVGAFTGTYTTTYGDLLFSNTALLSASPSVAVIGSPETISGSGLTAGGSYVVALGNPPPAAAGSVSTSAAALGVFTATSTGGVPSGTTITLADTVTKLETGTVEYFAILTAAHFGVATTSDAYAQFVLAASATLNMTTAPAGHSVTINAHALNSQSAYTIVFNYLQSPNAPNVYTGTPVGIIAPNGVGAGVASFNVPISATNGAYIVQLVTNGAGPGGATAGNAILDIPLTLIVSGTGTGTGVCNTTSCMAPGSVTSTNLPVGKAVVSPFTNTSNAPQTVIVYAVVHNAAGQTVSYSTGTLNNVPAGGSATSYEVLFGLAPGTYSVTVFATSTSGTAISTTSTVSVTV
jgi:hypothetical protein